VGGDAGGFVFPGVVGLVALLGSGLLATRRDASRPFFFFMDAYPGVRPPRPTSTRLLSCCPSGAALAVVGAFVVSRLGRALSGRSPLKADFLRE
jgi:hypothetical protein